jgi:hypothetical protein
MAACASSLLLSAPRNETPQFPNWSVFGNCANSRGRDYVCDTGALQRGSALTCHGGDGTRKGGRPCAGPISGRLLPATATRSQS